MLEPIEDNDLDLKKKFPAGGAVAEKMSAPILPKAEGKIEAVSISETSERKEGQAEKDDAYSKILSKVKSPSSVTHNEVAIDAKVANDETDYESKVVKLVEIAETKGVTHAVKVAQHMEDNYLLDSLHDRLLATDLHDALVKKGMITEI